MGTSQITISLEIGFIELGLMSVNEGAYTLIMRMDTGGIKRLRPPEQESI